MPILLAILLIPLVEIAIFMKVGQAIGVLDTLLLLVAAGLGGALLLRLQGLATLLRLRQRLAQGEAPVRELFDTGCLALAGVLLILPGFLSDLLALLLLLPPVRALAYARVAGWAARHGTVRGTVRSTARHGPVIDGDWTELSGPSLTQREGPRREGPRQEGVQRDDPNAPPDVPGR